MFGSRVRNLEIKILELERELNQESAKRIELEKQLSDEIRAHEQDKKKLEELQENLDTEKRTYEELQDALRVKMQEIDGRDRKRQEELAEEKKAADQEIRKYRDQKMLQIQKRIRDIEKNYCTYLGQLSRAAENISSTAVHLSDTYLDQEEETDLSKLFAGLIRSCFVDMPEEEETVPEAEPSFPSREETPG